MSDDMTIKDASGKKAFKVESKKKIFTNKYCFMDLQTDRKIAYAKQRFGMPMSSLYEIFVDGTPFACIKKKDTMCKPKFAVKAVNDANSLSISGNLLENWFVFRRGDVAVAEMRKSFGALTNRFTVDIQPGEDVIFILVCCVIIVICADA
ncbi:LURP-one-related domain-containing protein [Ditylenchus destructor]|uniref:LURP-one-related domain-containing protein n=1 Tax=Ditylenchus destructor TaxID=166010 RepID=A0AAD4MGL3_9BILA|nr:LURP-one-related domain-containing protein [Ditylenchus destructor]